MGMGPVAMVVGATGGIGTAVATALAERYTVCLCARDGPALEELAAKLPDAFTWPVDLSRTREISQIPDRLSGLSLLVHCAGLWAMGTIGDMPVDVWREIYDTNLFGVVDLTKRLLPALRATRGRVIVVNSTAISGSPANRAAFASSKAALRTFASALHQEELENGIRVTSVYPGRVDTKGQHVVRAAEGGAYEPERYLSAESVASAILWVISAPEDTHLTEFEVKPTWR
jgi:NADP-dependent 3-hydroxy acid dehydrogenase YdfG